MNVSISIKLKPHDSYLRRQACRASKERGNDFIEEMILLYKTKATWQVTTISEGRLAAQVRKEERILLYKTKPTYKLMTTILLMLQLR